LVSLTGVVFMGRKAHNSKLVKKGRGAYCPPFFCVFFDIGGILLRLGLKTAFGQASICCISSLMAHIALVNRG